MEATLDAGAENLSDEGDTWELICAPSDLAAARERARGRRHRRSSPTSSRWFRRTTVPVDDVSDARKVLRLIDALDEHDDVQNVWSNIDISDDVLAAVED